EGFVLRVCAGSWTGPFKITREMTILAEEGPDVTFLNGDGASAVLSITRVSGQVGVVGFTVQGGVGATNGGGIVASRSKLLIEGNTIVSNSAVEIGGGLYLENCTGSVTGNTIANNTAGSAGGIAVWDGDVTLDGNTISTNKSTSVDEELWGKGAGGGGLLVYGNSDVLNNLVDSNDSAYNAGGMYLYQGNGTIDGNTVQGNHGTNDGAGIFINYGSNKVTNNLIQDNVCDDDGGGMRVYVGQGVVVTDNTFLRNSTVDDGGGLKLSHNRNTIARNYFEGNIAGDAGGGLELDDETSNVDDCTFINNQASRGAGMHTWMAGGRITLQNMTFEGNVASVCGGAIGIDNDPIEVTFRHIVATGNSAVDGGAVCIDKQYQDDEQVVFEDSNVLFENVIFAKNSASDDGGFLYSVNGHTTFQNVTLYDNTGGEYGGFTLEDSSVSFINSIIADQDGPNFAGIKTDETVPSTATFSYNLFFDNDGGYLGIDDPVGSNGNILEDHLMVDPENGDYSLAAGSPAIDAGDPSIKDTDGSRSDLGAFGGRNGAW
ncbi:MAG TPA: hypothetical protein PLA94_25600, partial [Myxococcota bacterium]|nr:hypothetical protein [Myxococcota bacterium]